MEQNTFIRQPLLRVYKNINRVAVTRNSHEMEPNTSLLLAKNEEDCHHLSEMYKYKKWSISRSFSVSKHIVRIL